MKVLLVNGSPHKNGCTNRALEEVAKALEAEGVEAEVFWVGAKSVGGCIACGGCNTKGVCVLDEKVAEARAKAAEADGFVFGGAVHYAHADANLLGFMDRLFYSNGRAGEPNVFAHKPAAAVVSARRAGTTVSFDDINRFFTVSQMPIVSSYYWNNVHGSCAADVEQDEEGLCVMRQLGHNMAWMLKCIEAGRAAGIEPVAEPRTFTNFIR